MTYRVVESSELRVLVDNVNTLIAQGWTPADGFTVENNSNSVKNNSRTYYQPMIKLDTSL